MLNVSKGDVVSFFYLGKNKNFFIKFERSKINIQKLISTIVLRSKLQGQLTHPNDLKQK